MSPAVALRFSLPPWSASLHAIQIGDILLETTDGRKLGLRRVARPNAEQAALLAALKLTLPERLTAETQTAPVSGCPAEP